MAYRFRWFKWLGIKQNASKPQAKKRLAFKPLFVRFVIALMTLVVGLGCVAGLLFSPHRFSPAPKILVYIPPEASARKVSEILASSEMIFSDHIFLLYARLLGKSRTLRAGYYEMSPEWSIYVVLEILSSSTTQARLVRTTIPEGYALRQMAQLLSEKGVAPADALMQYWRSGVFSDYGTRYPYLMAVAPALIEGYLFPDTYLFAPNSSPKAITGMMLDAFDKKIFKLWEASSTRNILLKDFHDYLTLASLVEKEAVFRDEMPTIAGVFLNRLRLGMPLATDPTIVYAMGDVWRPQVFYKDLQVDSPYNTYKYKGLPPTPIASPGVAAFQAVLASERHGYLFFVALKDGGGRHVFTRSYREHLAAQGH